MLFYIKFEKGLSQNFNLLNIGETAILKFPRKRFLRLAYQIKRAGDAN